MTENIIREIGKNHICKAWEVLHKLLHVVHCFVGFAEGRKWSFGKLLFIIKLISNIVKTIVERPLREPLEEVLCIDTALTPMVSARGLVVVWVIGTMALGVMVKRSRVDEESEEGGGRRQI